MTPSADVSSETGVYASSSGDFSIALAGDCMLTRRLSLFDEPDFLSLVTAFRDCDAGFVNMETVVRNPDQGTPGITRGTYMTTDPKLLDELKWLGVNIVGCANNHAFDYGEGGVLATLDHLDAAGIAHAGSGRNLAQARRPAYLDTRGGRVALLAATSTFRPWNRASGQREDAAGRPGINPFSFNSLHTVDGDAMDALKRIATALGFDQTRKRNRGHFYSEAEAPDDSDEEIDLFGQRFKRGDFMVKTEADPLDVEDNLRWIREARRMADWVVVSFHSHEFAHKSVVSAQTRIDLREPADFTKQFARAAIDAGADIFAGHGSHTPLGIEIYKGRPIFYSLGNFIFQNETVTSFPSEAYGRFGLGGEATPSDFLDARTGNGSKGHVAHRGFWENIAVTCHFENKNLSEIRILPIDQGFGQPRGQRGRPVQATGQTAARIIERVAEFSRASGVTVKSENGIGIVRP